MSEIETLAACPFCGNDNDFRVFVYTPLDPKAYPSGIVECRECFASGRMGNLAPKTWDTEGLKSAAIAAWNTRLAPASDVAPIGEGNAKLTLSFDPSDIHRVHIWPPFAQSVDQAAGEG